MQRPSAGEVHVDQLLTGFSIKYRNPEYVGLRVWPTVKVKKQSDKYAQYGKEHLVVKPDEIGPGDEANEIFYTVDLTASYYADGHALKEKVPDEVKDNADDPLDPEFDATENVIDSIDLNREKRIKAAIDAAGITSSTPSPKWDAASATPIRDILQTAAKTVQNASLRVPNAILIPFNVAVALSWSADIKDLVKYTNPNLLIQAEGIILPKNLWGMEVIIPGCGENTANLGQTAVLSPIWDDDVIVFYKNPSPAVRHISFGYTFSWKVKEVKKWYEEKVESTWIQVKEYTDEKMVCADAAYILTECLI